MAQKGTDVAICVRNLSKTFRIPHEKISSVRGAFVNLFRRSTFEEFKALDDVSFEVKKGEFFGIIGRNGSGKSTLLKVLAGIYQADRGEVEIDGMISPFLELGIGFNPELSGRDNVYLNATVLGMTRKQIDEKFDSIVAFSELERFIDQKLKNYSSGMQVRLAFSVSIHANRDILLMDEVLAVGDSNFQAKCLAEFRKYKEMGKTVILVSHDIATVQRYCDRAMLIRNGRVDLLGLPNETIRNYISQNIADEQEAEVEHRETGKRGEGRVAKILSTVFLDRNGNETNVFHTGETMSIRVRFSILSIRKVFNFGISIFSSTGEYLYGTNTIFDEVDVTDMLQRGYYQVDFESIVLAPNSYYIHTSIAGNDFSSFYDFSEREKVFHVISDREFEGIIDLKHTWKS